MRSGKTENTIEFLSILDDISFFKICGYSFLIFLVFYHDGYSYTAWHSSMLPNPRDLLVCVYFSLFMNGPNLNLLKITYYDPFQMLSMNLNTYGPRQI